VPDLTEQTTALTDWLSTNGVVLAVVAIVLFLVYRWARPAIHRLLVNVMHAQAVTLGEGPDRHSEIDRRVATIEDLLAKVLRFTVVATLIVVVLGIFDLWSVLAGLGLLLAAITLAGQSIVLDYLMGFLILVEGQYFKGDTISVGAIEGTVEEVGLRRTVVRDSHGVVHSISNGTIRVSSNLTRIFAVAVVDIEGVQHGDVDRVIAMMDEVGRDVAADPAWVDIIVETPAYRSTPALTEQGVTLRMDAKVRTQGRWTVPAELRRRMALSLAAAGVRLHRGSGAPTGQDVSITTDVTGTGGGAPRG
jgi:moderate conductance mechanosensitive channel